MKIIKNGIFKIMEIILAICLVPGLCAMRLVRKQYMRKIGFLRRMFNWIGVFPIIDYYYEPLFNATYLSKSLQDDRNLPGIDFNVKGQLDILRRFKYSKELESFPLNERKALEFYYNNGNFEAGDAEYLYSMIRTFKPEKIIEIGSGFSTLMMKNAIESNLKEDTKYSNRLTCIEPFEMPWLEKLNIQVIRKKVETLDKEIFTSLKENDILFIDSSHIIRPQGDVLFEFLEILPVLKPGVFVQIHDIFTPKDYPDDWVKTDVRLWNEQYLLEAFLAFNSRYEVVGALNYLKNHYYAEFSEKCPVFKKEVKSEPGSFWIKSK